MPHQAVCSESESTISYDCQANAVSIVTEINSYLECFQQAQLRIYYASARIT